MTALAQYAKLEAEARYFDGLSSHPREVVISFGERSLVIIGYDDVVIGHWPLASLRALGLRGDPTVQIVPQDDSDERLVLSDAEMIRAIGMVCPDLYVRPVNRRGVGRALVWGAGAVGAVLVMVFVLVPLLADRMAELIPPEREVALGDSVVGQLQSLLHWSGQGDAGFCTGPEGQAALTRLVARLNPDTELPYPLRVDVIDHSLINALAVPGGRILLFRGLLEAADTPEEVAGVLAHEIGHVVSRDPTRGVLRAAGTAGILGLFLGDVFGGTVLVAASEAMLNATNQREAETLADETAYRLLARAKLPSRPFARFFEKMHDQYGDDDKSVVRYFASHPGLLGRAERAAAADAIGDGPFEPSITDRDWVALRGICDEGKPEHKTPAKKQ